MQSWLGARVLQELCGICCKDVHIIYYLHFCSFIYRSFCKVFMSLEKKYAKIIFDIASRENVVSKVFDDLNKLYEIISDNIMLSSFFKSPLLTFIEKDSIISKVFTKTDISGIAINSLRILLKNNRLKLFPIVIQAYHNILQESLGKRNAYATFVEAPSRLLLQKLNKIMDNQFGSIESDKKCSYNIIVHLDAELIGGFTVSFGKYLLDGSVRNNLNKIRRISL